MEARTTVHVESGSVRVTDNRNGSGVTLAPGEAASTAPRPDKPVSVETNADVERATAWRTGGFWFDNAPVGDVIAEIDRRFDIRVQAPPSIRLRRISVWKKTVRDPEEIMGDVAATIGVRYRRTANGYQFYLSE
jgi:ferric-dicitrate binding protein FerR (iron transport regulator)